MAKEGPSPCGYRLMRVGSASKSKITEPESSGQPAAAVSALFTTQRDDGGTGLGLCDCARAVAERHGGEVTFSTSPARHHIHAANRVGVAQVNVENGWGLPPLQPTNEHGKCAAMRSLQTEFRPIDSPLLRQSL